MANIPARFQRFAAAFTEAAKVRSPCQSSGSEHPADLSVLVNSFLERDFAEERESIEDHDDRDGDEINDDESEINSRDFELRDTLRKLFDDFKNDVVRRNIHEEVEKALKEVGGGGDKSSSPEFKRRLMAQLRDRGFDAGLCKSKWEKTGRCSAGDYEYIDINATAAAAGIGGGSRYIVEIFLAGEFTIARPTGSYDSLLEYFPQIFIGKPDELKQVVRLMCTAIKRSMKSMEIRVPPWRRHVYMQNKWFGLYRRTVNEVSRRKGLNIGWNFPAASRTVGFLPVEGVSLHCREGCSAVGGVRIGNLTVALRQ